jgi:hypothetical protein
MFDTMLRLTGMLLLAAASAAATAGGAPLQYGAFFAGAQVGRAEIRVDLNADGYEIAGEAWALGVLRTATQWRSDFSASGRIDEGTVVPEAYQFSSTRRGKYTRKTQVTDGHVETFRNGRRRDKGEAPAGLDVLTALFFAQDCATLDVLHTGTSIYQLEFKNRRVPEPGERVDYIERCEFEVIDEDGDGYRVDVQIGELNGHRIPLRIDVGGFITGSVRLLETPRNAERSRVAVTAGRD